MARYSQLVTLPVVPEDVKTIVHNLCIRWDSSGYGYKDKNYAENEQYQLQLLLNSNLGEVAIYYLLQQPDFRAEVNQLLADYPELSYNFIASSGYTFNNATGVQTEDAHDILDDSAENPDRKGWTDLIYKGQYDPRVIWSVEVKNTTTTSKREPSGFHKADIVFVIYQDTGAIEVLIPMIGERKSRSDSCYIKAGFLSSTANPGFKRILSTWEIVNFKD